MKVYKTIRKGDDTIHLIQHWDKDMRSFQLNDNMIFLINGGDTNFIHPVWKEKVLVHEKEFLEFLNDPDYPINIASIEEAYKRYDKEIEEGKAEYTSETY